MPRTAVSKSKGPRECLGIWSGWWLDQLLRWITHSGHHSGHSALKFGLMAVEHPKRECALRKLFGQRKRHPIRILDAINQLPNVDSGEMAKIHLRVNTFLAHAKPRLESN